MATGARGERFAVTLDPYGLAYGTYTADLVVKVDEPVSPGERSLTITLHVAPKVWTVFLPTVAHR